MAEKNTLTHDHYTIVGDEKQADAVAWAFVNKDELVKLPFKFEPLKDDEIRINVTHTGLCHADVMTGRGHWGTPKYPIAPGHEIVGIVSHVGKDVKDFKVGERVAYGTIRDNCNACRDCKATNDNLCTKIPFSVRGTFNDYWGGYATAIQHPAKWAYKLPEDLPSDCTPPILCAGITVYAPLVRWAKPGDRVAVIGIGGLGHMAVQYANKMGCQVTAFSSTKGKEDFLKNDLGAHAVVNSSDPEELQKVAGQFEVVINTLTIVDDKLTDLYVGLTANSGTFVQVGAPPVTDRLKIMPFQLIMGNINLAGSAVGSRKETVDCLEFSAKHKIFPICEFYDFEDLPKALDKLENGRPRFRCVVNVEEWSKQHNLFKQQNQ